MAGIIARDDAVHARLWHPPELHVGPKAAPAPVPAELQQAVEPEPIVLPTIAELEALRAKGYEDGFGAGRSDAQRQLAGEVEAIAQGVSQFAQQLAAVDAIYERFFAEVGRAIADAIDIVPPVQLAKKVQQALATIARPEGLVLCMHPDDVACLREVAPDVIDQYGLTINQTDAIGRGGFSIRSPFGEVDATLESTLQNLKKALQDVSV